ncbi:hypothetical protein DSO57_1017349 [Entomophthora muscae]|uniref:Uncharacterized protein n=1 Tax=Entomophthora muscae TaxID=34485 RepID=A0ACC2SHM3_9FUNG|nr:hypothetical protein DSO57_1017349 [Entomophthora muscae]
MLVLTLSVVTMSVLKRGAKLPNNYILRNSSISLVPTDKGKRPYREIVSGCVVSPGLARFDVEVDRFVTAPEVSKLGWKM